MISLNWKSSAGGMDNSCNGVYTGGLEICEEHNKY